MIKHIVMWRLKENAMGKTRAENAGIIKKEVEALEGKMKGLLKIEIGFDFSSTPESADIVLYAEFENRDALNVYQQHPLHTRIKPFIIEARAERRIVDYEG